MFKKTLYFFFVYFLSIFLFNTSIKAVNKCHFYLNDVQVASTNIPFYLYKTTKYDDPSSFPITKYKSSYTYIDTVEKCESIEEIITLKSYSSTVYDYNETIQTQYDNSQLFLYSKLNMEEGSLKGYSTIEDRLAPIFNNYLDKYTTNIDSPIETSTLLKSITAYDDTDGNITDKIEIIYDSYSSNKYALGSYLIMIEVLDSLLNKATLTLQIQVLDSTPPTITGKNHFVSYLSSPINTSEITSTIRIEDNYDKNLESELYVCEDNYSPNKNKPGIYQIYFCGYDYSENKATPFKSTIEVIDDIIPLIDGLNYYETSINSPLTINEILSSVIAVDNNQDITDKIYISEDNYSSFNKTKGEKTIYLQVMDSSNNVSKPFKIIVNIIDDVPPQIFGMNTFTSYLSNPLTTTYLKQQLSSLDNCDNNISHLIEIIDDSYTNNINNIGTYYLTMQSKDSSNNCSEPFKITITNIDDVIPYIEGKKELEYAIDNKPTIEQIILDNYTAIDNIDKNLNINITSDTYSISNSTGTYYVQLSCMDSNNNQSVPFQIKISVLEEIININETFLYLPTTKLFSFEEINKLINLDKQYTIINNNYTLNYSNEGNYTINYKLSNNDSIIINIQTYTPIIQPQKKETFLDKLKSFFNSIIKFFKKIFVNFINIYPTY